MKVVVTGVTLTGNLGGCAMLYAVKKILSFHIKDFALASILPKQDRIKNNQNLVRIISADYRIWLLFTTPLCLILWAFRKKKFAIWCARKIPILKEFADTDVIIDLCGISFVDGRGLGLLTYNIAIVLPGLFFDKPVYKLSQAFGPFQNIFNRTAAKWILDRCSKVVARGQKTLKYLRKLNIKNVVCYPDTSFALDISPDIKKKAFSIVNNKITNRKQRRLIIISPSAVVKKYCEKAGSDLVLELCQTIHALHEQGMTCALLPHSTYSGISKSDDLSVVKTIQERVKLDYAIDVERFDANGDPRLARAIIGNADAFIACRFHSLIAALSQAIPVVTIGWSHKYTEAVKPFGMDLYTINYSKIKKYTLVKYVNKLIINRKKIVKVMKIVSKKYKKQAADGIRLILKN